jgi:hypothetical protein
MSSHTQASLVRALVVLGVFVTAQEVHSATITHKGLGCAVAEQFPSLEARLDPPSAVARARVFFQAEEGPHWYSVAMVPAHDLFAAALPKPKKSLRRFTYYIEVVETSLASQRTEQYTVNVAADKGGCKSDLMAMPATVASILLQAPAGAPLIPVGFSSVGVVAAGSAAAAPAAALAGTSSGGGVGAGTVGLGVLGAGAVAGVVVATGSGGGAEPSAGPTSTTERWAGVAPEGMIVEANPAGYCPAEFDLELSLTTSGTTVSGTATTRLRKTTPGQQCSDVLGRVSTYGLFNGKAEANTISFDLGSNGAYRFSGTFTATRMTGTFFTTDFPQSGRFIVNRQ